MQSFPLNTRQNADRLNLKIAEGEIICASPVLDISNVEEENIFGKLAKHALPSCLPELRAYDAVTQRGIKARRETYRCGHKDGHRSTIGPLWFMQYQKQAAYGLGVTSRGFFNGSRM